MEVLNSFLINGTHLYVVAFLHTVHSLLCIFYAHLLKRQPVGAERRTTSGKLIE
jgi:hypothetical protein